MTTVQAGLTYYKQLNEQIRAAQDSEITVENVIGQRYIGCGSTDRARHGRQRSRPVSERLHH